MTKYSEEELIEELHRVSKEHCDGEAPRRKDIKKFSLYSQNTYFRRFGSWENVCKKMGFCSDNRSYSKEKLLDEIKRVSEKYCQGETPRCIDMREYGDISEDTYFRRFETWNEAVEKAGFEANCCRQGEITNEDLLEEIINLSQKKDKKPCSKRDMEKFGEYSQLVYRRRFGSWNKAVEEADFETREPGGLTGKENPSWNGGIDNFYGSSWQQNLKEDIRKRDGYVCRICGMENKNHREKFIGGLNIHHISPKKYWNVESEHEQMNHPRNLISLCFSCHRKVEGKFKGRNHEEFEKLAKDYLDVDETEEKKGIFDY